MQEPIVLENGTLIWPRQGILQTQCGELEIEIAPLLTFMSRSPDRFWTLFAPPKDHLGPRRQLSSQTPTEDGFLLSYVDDDHSWLAVYGSDKHLLRIESFTNLPNPVYSHLNSYVQIIIRSGSKLEISFDSAGAIPVEFVTADYPIGRPRRMAYYDQTGRFSVVEASSAEKGPFHTLATGQLERSEALTFTLYSTGRPQCLITLEDWAAQTSTQLSPTAGWGVTENAIEFSLSASRSSDGLIYISLANTSTGRGFDTVGHTAGLYRNRMRVEPLEISSTLR